MQKGQKSVRGGIEDLLHPVTDMYITQGSNGGYSHQGIMANDIRGKNAGVKYAYYAPCTCKCKKIYPDSGQSMWQSTSKVRFADGRVDYFTFMIAHDDTQDCKVGQIVKQGLQLGNMGLKGLSTGVHLHLQTSAGTSTRWYKNKYGNYQFDNEVDLDSCFFMDGTNILNGMGGSWKYLKDVPVDEPEETKRYGTPVTRNENVNQIKIKDDKTTVRARKSPNGDVLGYMNVGIYNSLEIVNQDGYDWHKVENDLWFAHSKDWSEVLLKKEPTPAEPIDEDKEKIKRLEEEVVKLNDKIKLLEKEITSLNNKIKIKDEKIKTLQDENTKLQASNKSLTNNLTELEQQITNQPTLVFISPKTNYYGIYLEEGKKVYLD